MVHATGLHGIALHAALFRQAGQQGICRDWWRSPTEHAQALACAVTGPATALVQSPHDGRAVCSARASPQALPPSTLQGWLVLHMSGAPTCSGYTMLTSPGTLQSQQGLLLSMWSLWSTEGMPQAAMHCSASSAAQRAVPYICIYARCKVGTLVDMHAAKLAQSADVSSAGSANFCQAAQSSHGASKLCTASDTLPRCVHSSRRHV